MQFRKDINGLRAIAVIAVVVFHFNASWVPGGFAGVDVFFVISGFLMTGIICKKLEFNNFSIIKFYIARANRIIPALAMLCLMLLIIGWFYLTPIDYKNLGKHIAASTIFISNIVYWKESGYFDVASQGKWLLHTWSLSVEWQFYLIYPLALIVIRKFMSEKRMKVIVLIGMFLSLVLCIIATYKWPNPTYYLLPTRAWEMMLGGIAYLYPITFNEKGKKLSEILGFLLIIGSYFLISKDNPWPGYLALFPVAGTFLIIQANKNDSFITSNIILQKIGSWSYSIYLWHWPLAVSMYYFTLSEEFIILGIGLSILLGFFSNKYIESIRFSVTFNNLWGYLKYKPALIATIITIFGLTVFISEGAKFHYPDAVLIASNEATNKNPYRCMHDEKFPCYIGNKENVKAIVVGDSHADALTTSIASSVNLANEGVIALTMRSCPFILNFRSTIDGDKCYRENLKRTTFLESNYKNVPVFWIARTSAYLYGQSNPHRIKDIRDTKPSIFFTTPYERVEEALFEELKNNLSLTIKRINNNHPVYMVQPTPEMRQNIPLTLAKNIVLGDEGCDLSIAHNLYNERNKKVRELIDKVATENNASVLDPIPYLCTNNRCIAQIDGRPIYYDGDHMSEFGNKLVTPMFKSVIEGY